VVSNLLSTEKHEPIVVMIMVQTYTHESYTVGVICTLAVTVKTPGSIAPLVQTSITDSSVLMGSYLALSRIEAAAWSRGCFILHPQRH